MSIRPLGPGPYAVWLTLFFCFLGAGCASLPTDYETSQSTAFRDTAETRLGKGVAAWTADHGGLSGFYPLPNGLDALGARLSLIDFAERSIDAQYFLMKPDDAGLIFAGKLIEAANRGVRVRFLLDDVFTTVDDDSLLVLDAHPNIEIRLFNPVARGGISTLNFLGDFKRANRRMHNKSFTVDNQATIVGGRNIADEYFQLNAISEFLDYDMFAVGPVAAEVSQTFDRFWNHPLAIPISAFSASPNDLEEERALMAAAYERRGDSIYRRAINAPLVQALLNGEATLLPAESEVITDEPDKLLNKVSPDHQVLVTRMAEVVDDATEQVLVISPYFIPGKDGVAFWRRLVDRGVRVIVVTNSLASNNHTAVHSAYARYRKSLLEAGVELYEVRANATAANTEGEAVDSLTLHTKAVLVDHDQFFVGSLNLDPRSIDINTEMGILINSEALTRPITNRMVNSLPGAAYRLTLTERKQLQWHALIDGETVVETREPLAGAGLRFKAFLLKLAPESQL